MIIQCDSCKAKYRLNEDRIAGKGARVKCRKCSDYIIVMKPEYEHLKSEFINGINAEELKKRMEEEVSAEQPEETEPAPPPPPAEKVAAEEQRDQEIREPLTEEPGVREMARPPELVEEEELKKRMEEEASEEQEEITEPESPPTEKVDVMQEREEETREPLAEDASEGELAPPKEFEEVVPPAAESVSEEAFRTEELPGQYEQDTQETGIDTGTQPMPGETEEEDSTQQDDIDMAFEKFLGSLRDESKISLDALEQPESEDEQRVEPEAATGEETEMAGSLQGEEVGKEEEQRPEILSASETLDFISKDVDAEEAVGDFDLKLQDEKIDFQDPIDLSGSIVTKPEIGEEEAGVGEPPSETIDSWTEPELPDSQIDISEPVAREKPSPYEYVPKTVVKSRKKSKLAGFLMVLLIFLIVIAGAGAYLAFTKPGNELLMQYAPQVRSLFGMKEGAPASQYDITNLIGYYETNRNTGKIFIIKGEVVNLSNTVSSGIVLKGQLLDERSNVLKDKTVYAGNSLENKAIKNASKRSIEESLQNKLGKNLSNIDIQPGSSVPFMIVFFDLPEKIEAYKVQNVE
jgi:predicted Zn finger-like uncharacterized protein